MGLRIDQPSLPGSLKASLIRNTSGSSSGDCRTSPRLAPLYAHDVEAPGRRPFGEGPGDSRRLPDRSAAAWQGPLASSGSVQAVPAIFHLDEGQDVSVPSDEIDFPGSLSGCGSGGRRCDTPAPRDASGRRRRPAAPRMPVSEVLGRPGSRARPKRHPASHRFPFSSQVECTGSPARTEAGPVDRLDEDNRLWRERCRRRSPAAGRERAALLPQGAPRGETVSTRGGLNATRRTPLQNRFYRFFQRTPSLVSSTT